MVPTSEEIFTKDSSYLASALVCYIANGFDSGPVILPLYILLEILHYYVYYIVVANFCPNLT